MHLQNIQCKIDDIKGQKGMIECDVKINTKIFITLCNF